MKRFILDIIVILFIVSIVSVVTSDVDNTMNEQLISFENQISSGMVYQPSREVYLLQIEENSAGKLGNALSVFVVRVVNESFSLLKDFFEVF